MFRIAIALLLTLPSCGAASSSDDASATATSNQTAPAARSPGDARAAGTWRASDGALMTSELVLAPDGSFRFTLVDGAINEHGRGRWSSDGRTVTLNSDPRPAPLAFTAGPVTRRDDVGLLVRVVNARSGATIEGVEATIGLANGEETGGTIFGEGWVSPPLDVPPRWISLRFPEHEIGPTRFPVDAAAGNVFEFRLNADEIGAVGFRDTPLQIAGDTLVLRDGERIITYSRGDGR